MSFGTLLWALIAWEIFKTIYFKIETSIDNYIWEQKKKKNPEKHNDLYLFETREEREKKRKAEAEEMLQKIMVEIKKEIANQVKKSAPVKKAAPKRK
jgi:hypothetical protein